MDFGVRPEEKLEPFWGKFLKLPRVQVTSLVMGILGSSSQTDLRARKVTDVLKVPGPVLVSRCSRPGRGYPCLVGAPPCPGAESEATMGLVSMGAERGRVCGIISGLGKLKKS